MQNYTDNLLISNLIELIQQKRNADFQCLACSINPLHLFNIGSHILIHTAAATNNIEVITFLTNLGFNIDTQNVFGQTPLHLAMLHRHFRTVQYLLSLEPNIFIVDNRGTSPLQLCFLGGSLVPEYITICFFERLKRVGLSAEKMTNELEKAGCFMYQILLMNEVEVTERMLDRKTLITENEVRALLERAMSSDYTENVRALLYYEPGSKERIDYFLDRIIIRRYEPVMKLYFKLLVKWEVITEDFVFKAMNAFNYGSENYIQIYLDIGIDDYAREEYDCELLVGLFTNEKVDCLKIIKNRNFNVNGLDMYGNSALHMSCMIEDKAVRKTYIEYLFTKNANPNIQNFHGETPLFNSCGSNGEITELLLEAGSDLQIADTRGKIVLDIYTDEVLVAHFCILEGKGLVKRKYSFQNKANPVNEDDGILFLSNRQIQKMHYYYRPDIEWLKTRNILKSINLFSVLADNVQKTARYVKNEFIVEAILEASCERELQPIYKSLLKKNCEKALKVYELRPKVAVFFSNVMRIYQSDHLVIEKVISFLTYRDFLIFDNMDI